MGEGNEVPARDSAPTPPRLTAGGLVAGGRYELLESHGGIAGQAFWKARDRRLDRPVALTFVDPLPGEQPPGSATGVLDRTVALTAVYSDGLARVLDVIRGRAGGIVVCEWIPGRSLAAAVASPDPDSAVRAVWGLSDAATLTEEKGLFLGLDSPDRVRLTEDGRAVLAFPGVAAGIEGRTDVRGLGAVLYAMLTGAWPLELPEGSGSHEPVDGRPKVAQRDDDDKVLDPTVAASGVAPESAVLAMRSLDGTAVSSAATVRAMVADRTGGPVQAGHSADAGPAALQGAYPGSASTGAWAGASAGVGAAWTGASAGADAAGAGASTGATGTAGSGANAGPGTGSAGATSAARTAGVTGAGAAGAGGAAGIAGRATSGASAGTDGASGSGSDDSSTSWFSSADPTDPDVQKRRWQIMAGAGAAAVVAIVLLTVWMLGALSGDRNNTPLSAQLDAIEQAAQASRSSEAAAPPAEESGENTDSESSDKKDDAESEKKKPDAKPISVSTATSWQPASSNGNPENSASAPNVIDGDRTTSWSTDTYRDQFGTGPSAYKAGIGLMLTLDDAAEVQLVELSSDEDIRFEVRSSETATPSSLDDTTRLGSGRVRDGSATVEISKPEKAEYVLVWITQLGTSGPQAYDASITEVELLG